MMRASFRLSRLAAAAATVPPPAFARCLLSPGAVVPVYAAPLPVVRFSSRSFASNSSSAAPPSTSPAVAVSQLPSTSAPSSSGPFLLRAGSDRHTVDVLVSEATEQGRFVHRAVARGKHQFAVAEKGTYGGADEAPSPYDLMCAALGACTSITLRLFAERRRIDLPPLQVTVLHCKKRRAELLPHAAGERGQMDLFEVSLRADPPLDAATRSQLLAAASHCLVHHTLSGNSDTLVRTRWSEEGHEETTANIRDANNT